MFLTFWDVSGFPRISFEVQSPRIPFEFLGNKSLDFLASDQNPLRSNPITTLEPFKVTSSANVRGIRVHSKH